jgi:hypothetical protein
MSSYLLLRNNKESGPFTIDEIKEMTLKAYDLLWIVGKSAAWRYPGEIPEIKPFAPPVPEPTEDNYRKKKSESLNAITKETTPQKTTSSLKSVYVNLPAEKKQVSIQKERFIIEWDSSEEKTPALRNSDLYTKKHSRPARISGKILWTCTIILLFGAGLLTGFVISDRGIIFSKDEIHPQHGHLQHPVDLGNEKKIADKTEILVSDNPNTGTTGITAKNPESVSDGTDLSKTTHGIPKKNSPDAGKKKSYNALLKKDSVSAQNYFAASSNINDSLKKNQAAKSEMLYQKIKAHPESYVELVMGRYTTGVFGGISSFPVTVTNNSAIVMDQVIVNIDYIQNNDKIFKTESLYFTGLEPGETVTLKAPKSPRGVKVTSHLRIVNSAFPDTSDSN